MPSSRRNGSADSAIAMACGQPGRIGSGVTVCAALRRRLPGYTAATDPYADTGS
jgi:hypothetical protein